MSKDSAVQRQTYTATELAAYLGISRSGAYNLMQAVDFPSFRIGGRIMVTRVALENWLLEQQQKEKRAI